MKTLKFILQKVVIVEVMLIIIYFAKTYFGVNIDIINLIVDTSLKYLTPVAFISLIGYFILSILSNRIIEIILGIVLGGLILSFILKYYNVI